MNNIECTQKVILEKLMKYANGDSSASVSQVDEKDYISIMYRFLNATIDNRFQTSARVVTTSRKGLLGKFAIFCKKVIRKISFWYVEPICKSQTQFNEMCTQFCINAYYLLNQMQAEKKEKEAANLDLQSKVQTLEAELEKVSKQLELLKTEGERIIKDEKLIKDEMQNACGKIEMLESQASLIHREFSEISNDMNQLRAEIPDLFEKKETDFWNKQTVAQSGEDAILAYVLMVLGIDCKKEHYLDLGANHARELSNTYMLYRSGMRGVLVEANPHLISEYKLLRSEDIVINKCVANESGQMQKFYVMNGDGLSSSSVDSVNEVMGKNPDLAVSEIIEMESITVNDILKKYFDRGPLVLNIDIEGMEEDILRSIDYENYAPRIIIVERIEYDTTIATCKREDNISKIMEEKGYFEYAFTGINSIFIHHNWLKEINK